MHTLLEGARRPAAEAIARKQEGRGVSGPQRSRPRRNATAARINRSRDPGEFIRFVAASLKAARVSFASRSLLAVYGEGDVRGGPRVCMYTLERTAIVEKKRERERPFKSQPGYVAAYIRSTEEKSPTGLFELASSSSSSSSLSRPFFLSSTPLHPLFSPPPLFFRSSSCCFRDGGTSKRETKTLWPSVMSPDNGWITGNRI